MIKMIKFLLFLFVLCEILSFFSLRYLANNSAISIVYKTIDTDKTNYFKERDQHLGWPTQSLLASKNFNSDGARPCPSCLTNTISNLQIFGDSFVRGAEVSDKDCWANLIAQKAKVNCKNYGVNGYGTDQAFLRYMQKKDSSELAILGFTSDNILRNVNSYRNLLSASMDYIGLKPRYILNEESSQVELIPLPGNNVEEINKIISAPHLHLKHDYFNASNEGPIRNTFPFTLQLFKLKNHYLIKSKIKKQSFYQDFLKENHPSKATEITGKIFELFYDETKAKNQKGLILLFPQGQDFGSYFESGQWSYIDLIYQLEQNNIPHLNLGPAFLKTIKSPSEINSVFATHGHYNTKGNAIVANAVLNYLEANAFIPKNDQQ